MGIISPEPPPPQDAPPPRRSFPSQDRKVEPATSWQLSSNLRQLLSSSELKFKAYDVVSKIGRERVSVLCCLLQPQPTSLLQVLNVQVADNFLHYV